VTLDNEFLDNIDRKLTALLALAAEEYIRETPENSTSRSRLVEEILLDSGLTSHEAAKMLGKSRQAVEQRVARSATTNSKKSTRSKKSVNNGR
jgi:hypothetical protein